MHTGILPQNLIEQILEKQSEKRTKRIFDTNRRRTQPIIHAPENSPNGHKRFFINDSWKSPDGIQLDLKNAMSHSRAMRNTLDDILIPNKVGILQIELSTVHPSDSERQDRIKYAEEDVIEEKVKDEGILFPESEITEKISFFEEEPIQSKKLSKISIPIEEPTVKEIQEPEFEKRIQSNDFELSKELERFDAEEIKIKFPNTDPEQCLLRPKMIDELIKNRPTTRDQFLQMIPQYLRQSTFGQENKIYLDSVLEIISEFVYE